MLQDNECLAYAVSLYFCPNQMAVRIDNRSSVSCVLQNIFSWTCICR